jgi:N-formylglutamate amidohydrolase
MRIVEDFAADPPFDVVKPAAPCVPFVFNSPHSGACYPAAFLAASRLDAARIRCSEDSFVDQIFGDVVQFGAALMRAHFPRAYLDVNREPYELDPEMFRGGLPAYANVRSLRVAGGLGTIARVVSEQEEIYAGPLDVDEALARIETIYKPYHAVLRRLLAETHVRFGWAVLVDCHSMPSACRGADPRHRADIILGDRYGTSCSPGLIETAESLLRDLGFSVAVNKPYAGGFITEHYGRPASNLNAFQIEISRGLYMNERTLKPNAGFAATRQAMSQFSRGLIEGAAIPAPIGVAAE